MTIKDDIKERVIIKLGDESNYSLISTYFDKIYSSIRNSLIRENVWRFAIAEAKIYSTNLADLYSYKYAYPLPSDCLRFLSLIDNVNSLSGSPNSIDNRSLVFQIDGKYIKTNYYYIDENDLKYLIVKFLKNVDDELMDTLFIECLILKLTIECTEKQTLDVNKRAMYEKELISLLNKAKLVDAIQVASMQISHSDTYLSRL